MQFPIDAYNAFIKKITDVDQVKVKKYLIADEKAEHVIRFHPVALIRPAAPVLIVFPLFVWSSLAGTGLLSVVLWWVFVACLLWLIWNLVDWWREWLATTNTRIFRIHGIIKRKLDMMALAKVTDCGYDRSFLGQLLNYGALRLESAGQSSEAEQQLQNLTPLPNPDELFVMFTQKMLGKPSGPSAEVVALHEIRDLLLRVMPPE